MSEPRSDADFKRGWEAAVKYYDVAESKTMSEPRTFKRAIRDYWQGYGYDHLPGCPAVPRCTCGFVETMRAFFDRTADE